MNLKQGNFEKKTNCKTIKKEGKMKPIVIYDGESVEGLGNN